MREEVEEEQEEKIKNIKNESETGMYINREKKGARCV